MRIKCISCGYFACGTDVASHMAVGFMKIFAPIATVYLTKILTDAFETKHRSIADNSTAFLGNATGMPCPKCDKKEKWTPWPEGQEIQLPVTKKESEVSQSQ